VIIEETAFLKVSRSINHKSDGFNALIEADRGAEYRRASSPNPSPCYMHLFETPLISTASFPSWRMKNELAILFCFIKYCPSLTLQSLNFSRSSSLISLSSMRAEKVKCVFRLLRMSVLSLMVFF
jgi:hypothetical protein